MKMNPEHTAALKAAIQPLDTPGLRAKYRARDIPHGALVNDIDKRYRWDLFWASKPATSQLYLYLDDSHIDTALRSIVPAID